MISLVAAAHWLKSWCLLFFLKCVWKGFFIFFFFFLISRQTNSQSQLQSKFIETCLSTSQKGKNILKLNVTTKLRLPRRFETYQNFFGFCFVPQVLVMLFKVI